MLFYGKEIDIFYIILLVIFILVVYILISYYMQQKQSIALTTSSQPIITSTNIIQPLYLKKDSKETLKRGAFAISLWLNIDSWVPPLAANATFNILTMNNTSNQIFSLYIDNTCKLSMNSTFFINSTSTLTSILPIKEPVNIILNYNGDDDYDEDKNQFFTAKDGTTIPMYTPNKGFAYSNRALDVFINGRLNNTIILNTSLTKNDKSTTTNCNASCVSYNDASMNYFIDDNIQFLIGNISIVPGPVGTISNVTFIKDGCSVEDAQSINNSGNSSNILDNLFSYKLQFSLLEDDKKVKVVELL
jgi:hypothetical protein